MLAASVWFLNYELGIQLSSIQRTMITSTYTVCKAISCKTHQPKVNCRAVPLHGVD